MRDADQGLADPDLDDLEFRTKKLILCTYQTYYISNILEL